MNRDDIKALVEIGRLAEAEAEVWEQRDLRNHQCKLKLEAMARAEAAEAALPAVDPRIMEFLQHVADGSAKDYTNNHKWAKELIAAIRTLPTAAELMARINEGEKE